MIFSQYFNFEEETQAAVGRAAKDFPFHERAIKGEQLSLQEDRNGGRGEGQAEGVITLGWSHCVIDFPLTLGVAAKGPLKVPSPPHRRGRL